MIGSYWGWNFFISYTEESKNINYKYQLDQVKLLLRVIGKIYLNALKNAMKRSITKGVPRIYTTIKVDTRIDKLERFKDRVNSVLDN
tara:strand:+ start:224 stop:484 length:261 start_codon:yes stop_codon:yes gene_type:complete